jgi:hypothetical protein
MICKALKQSGVRDFTLLQVWVLAADILGDFTNAYDKILITQSA